MRDEKKEILTFLEENVGTPQIAGNLEGLERIGEGGMSFIYRARQKNLGRYVVIKQLKHNEQEELIERFRREARTLASVLHQNVAHVYDYVESGEHHYIFMEYISGVDLSAVIKQTGNLPPHVAAATLLGVARGVNALHGHQLIHRDVKPSNIRITDRGEVKLMDLGIVLDTNADELTRPGILVGSRFYLSPEQVLGEAASPRSDIFLLGICLYEMLAGVRPFVDEGRESVFQRIREAKYVPLRKMRSSVPRALEAIVDRCLRKNPEQRYQSSSALAYDLQNFLGTTRAAHTREMILSFLDAEALLKSPVAVSASFEVVRAVWKAPLRWLATGAVIILFGFALGYVVGHSVGSGPQTPVTYEAPKKIR